MSKIELESSPTLRGRMSFTETKMGLGQWLGLGLGLG